MRRYDIEHSLERATEERAAAAAGAAARDVHLDLAGRYADRAWGHREQRCADAERC